MTNPNKSNDVGGTMSTELGIPIKPTDLMIFRGMCALLQCSRSELEGLSHKLYFGYEADVRRVAIVILDELRAAQASIATPQPQSVRDALEKAAKVADARAQKHALEADKAEANGEHDEVSGLKSTAWNISIVAHEIRALIEPLSAATGGQESEAQDEHMPETSAALQMAQESAALEEFGMKVASAVRQECQDRMEVDSYGLPDDEYLRSAIVNSLIGEKK